MFVGNSYDPNDKTVDQPEVISPDVTDELIYRIRFQNTGTAPAQNVYIMDTLSSNLNWSTFEFMNASHNVEVINYGNGIIKFNFPNIWLPDSTSNLEASQGYVTFKITENSGNGIGVSIENTAHIFFDWNEAIVTNTTYNINDISGGIDQNDFDVVLHPNPTNGVLHLTSDWLISSVVVFDLTGKVVHQSSGNDVKLIDLSDASPGVYISQIVVNGQLVTYRIVKQ